MVLIYHGICENHESDVGAARCGDLFRFCYSIKITIKQLF